jgi:hypothetical protein
MVRVARSLFASVFSILLAVSPMLAQQANSDPPLQTRLRANQRTEKKMGRRQKAGRPKVKSSSARCYLSFRRKNARHSCN